MRWPAAVVVVPGDAAGALTRDWVYTAFGRGERHLSVVQGAEEALPGGAGAASVARRGRLHRRGSGLSGRHAAAGREPGLAPAPAEP